MFSIIIPTCNRPDTLERTVNSILKLDIMNKFEIIIVNDHPLIPLKNFPDDRVRIIENSKNLGRSKSRNIGALNSIGEYFFFIDDDIEVKENLFDKYMIAYKKGYDSIFSNVINVRTDAKFSFLNEFIGTRGANKKKSDPDKTGRYFITQFCSIRSDFFNSIGRFDEKFAGYGWEDTELGLRIEKNGGKISFIKTENLIHYHDKDVFEWLDQLENSGSNLRYLMYKHPAFKKNIKYDLLTSVLGTLAFNPLFFAVEKMKAKHLKGYFGYINYSYLFYAAIYRSLMKFKKQV